MQQMTAPELAAWIADTSRAQPVLLDVREPREHQTCMIEGSVPIPMNTIPSRLSELEQDAPIVCICHHGARSMQVANFLEQNGFTNMINLTGGIHAWAQQVDPSMPTY
jgi:rhodanese-related sulfurtransferase